MQIISNLLVSVIQLHDKQFVPFISASEIDKTIAGMAQQIEADTSNEVPVFVGVLNGAFMFLSDLMKHYKKECEVSFVKLASYEGTQSTNTVKQLVGLDKNVEGRTVIIVEDIVDTGNTVVELVKMFEGRGVKQLKIASLFFKPEAYKKDIKLNYTGFSIPNKFIVGYGLDYDGLGRNIPEIYQLK